MSLALIRIVDDDEEMRTAVARLLQTAGYEVRTYSSAGDFLLAPPDPTPGCIVLDLQMPGPSGLELQRALQLQPTPLPIVFVTGHADVGSTVAAMKAGAVDFLTKPAQPADILAAVPAATARDAASRARHAQLERVRQAYARLTERERAVFARVAAGERNKAIARALGITERTVKMHRAQVMAKMEADSAADLVRIEQVLARS